MKNFFLLSIFFVSYPLFSQDVSISTTNQTLATSRWKPSKPLFKDRDEAGRILGRKLFKIYGDQLQNAVVLGCVRGGLVVAAAVVDELKSQAVNTELDIVVTRRIGDPNNLECAVGYLTEEGASYFLEDLLAENHIDPNAENIQAQIIKGKKEIERRIQVYRGDRVPVSLEHRKVIIIDDGMASGGTTIAAIKSIVNLSKGTAEIIVGQPVASNRAIERTKKLTEIKEFCIVEISKVPKGSYWDIEDYYADFSDVSDEIVTQIMSSQNNVN